MKEFWGEFFKFIERLFPALTAFFIGKKVGEIGKEDIRAKRDALKLEIERFKIKERVREEHDGKSDSDVIDSAIARGHEMLKRKRPKGDE